jgi:hypothetical protein
MITNPIMDVVMDRAKRRAGSQIANLIPDH